MAFDVLDADCLCINMSDVGVDRCSGSNIGVAADRIAAQCLDRVGLGCEKSMNLANVPALDEWAVAHHRRAAKLSCSPQKSIIGSTAKNSLLNNAEVAFQAVRVEH